MMNAPGSSRIRLLIADDHSVIRHGLRAVFEKYRDFEIVGEAADVPAATALGCATNCDVALVDLRLGGGSGIDVIRAWRHRRAACRAVVLTGYGTMREVEEAFQAGAYGCVLKDADATEIVGAVLAAHAGRRYLSAGAAELLSDSKHTASLTEREQQVLELLVPGHRNRAIAKTLGLAEETVKGHVKKILIKLGVRDRTEAATQAIRRGMVRVD